jgi:hypothetical protein
MFTTEYLFVITQRDWSERAQEMTLNNTEAAIVVAQDIMRADNATLLVEIFDGYGDLAGRVARHAAL